MATIRATEFSIDSLFSSNAQLIMWITLVIAHSQITADIRIPTIFEKYAITITPEFVNRLLLIALVCVSVTKLLRYINDWAKPKYPHNVSKNDGNQVVLIIGGSRGLGFELAKLFLKKTKCRVCLVDCIDTSISRDDYKQFYFYKVDVADSSALISTFDKIIHDVGPVTTLVNNVGIAPMGKFADMTIDEIQRILDVNLRSYLLSVNYFLSHASKTNHPIYIMNIASVLGLASPAYLAMYSATKAAIIALHESVFHEYLCEKDSTRQVGLLLVKIGQLDTTLFAKVAPPRQFLAPVLSHKKLAFKLWQKWSEGQLGEASWPGYTHFGAIFKVLPFGIVEILRSYSRIDKSLETDQYRSHVDNKTVLKVQDNECSHLAGN